MQSQPAIPARSGAQRWRGASAFLAGLRSAPGSTRAAIGRQIGMTSSSITELAARLRRLDLVTEQPATPSGPGRPTTTVHPHPNGPVVVLVAIGDEDWTCAIAGIDGRPAVTVTRRHRARTLPRVLTPIAEAVEAAAARHAGRVVAVSVAVAGTVVDNEVVQASSLRWGRTDLAPLSVPGVPLLVGNDATLAGLAEARIGAASGASAALHIIVDVGVGGALIIGGQPAVGAHGAGGEFGHLPFGDQRLRCPCGARGCWDLEVDGRALARHLGRTRPADPRAFARRVLAAADAHDDDAAAAVAIVARRLAGGVAGLVNALDPDVVTLGGLAPAIRAAAPRPFDQSFRQGLMRFRRDVAPPLLDAEHGDAGALRGAAIVGLDATITEIGLAQWARRRRA
jgi:predicted NBD/HSP70 family sugar kinase